MDLNNQKILVADDDEAIQICIEDIAQLEGWSVVFASDGEECVAKLRTENPRLLVLDQRMPKMTGEEILRMLDQINPTIPVIVITAERDAEHLKDVSPQVSMLLRKPFDLENFINAVNGILGRS